MMVEHVCAHADCVCVLSVTVLVFTILTFINE